MLPTPQTVRKGFIAHVKSLNDADLLKEIPSPFAKGAMTTVGFRILESIFTRGS